MKKTILIILQIITMLLTLSSHLMMGLIRDSVWFFGIKVNGSLMVDITIWIAIILQLIIIGMLINVLENK